MQWARRSSSKPRGGFTPLTDMLGGGRFALRAGEWTDDTSMALCLAQSLVRRRGFDPRDQMNRYLNGYTSGYPSSTGTCFDIGNTVREALETYRASGDPFSGSTDSRSAGNGSLRASRRTGSRASPWPRRSASSQSSS